MVKGFDYHKPFEKEPAFYLYRGFDLLDQKCADWLYSYLDKYQIDLLIMEPMYKMFNLPLNKPESAGPILRAYEEIQIRFPKIHIHTAHHERRLPPTQGKNADLDSREKVYGPMQIYADMDWQIFLSSDGNDFDPTFTLKFLSNDIDVLPFTLKRDPDTLLYIPYSTENKKLEAMWKVLNDTGKELKQIEFKKACTEKGITIGRNFLYLLNKGAEEKLWTRRDGEKNYILYKSLPRNDLLPAT
jgi:hypothetical protein